MKTAISINCVSKKFKLYSTPKDRLKEWVNLGFKKYHDEFWALKEIDFSVSQGETVGILGRNGSGKSTLLQIITGIMSPTKGTIERFGRISALLELGTGFDLELTGRENLYLSGSIMGFSKKEIRERIPMIENFAEIGRFLDHPVRMYSSGTYVRLAFSQAIHVDPDILIIDEALAVGDIRFQNKCYRKFREFKEEGRTILFVTHSTELLAKHCDRAVLLENGRLLMDDKPNKVINQYFEILLGTEIQTNVNGNKSEKESIRLAENSEKDEDEKDSYQIITDKTESSVSIVNAFLKNQSLKDRCSINPIYNQNEHRYGNAKGKIIDFLAIAENTINPPNVNTNSTIELYVKYSFFGDVNIPIFGFTLKTVDGIEIFGSNSLFEKIRVNAKQAGEVCAIKVKIPLNLIPSDCFISVGLAEYLNSDIIAIDRRYDLIHLKIINPTSRYGIANLEMSIEEIA